MPAKLSKFNIASTCQDYAHPWSSSCVSTTTGLGLHALQESLRIYTTVYFIALLMRGKVPTRSDIKKTILSILQSTAFLSWSAFTFPVFICGLRRILGNFNILTVSFIPSFLSNLTAIIVERPSRRTMLCLYVSNIATEALFRMAVWRGYISPVSYGQVYIFALSMAVLMYFFRCKRDNQDSIFRIIRIVVGQYEDEKYLQTQSRLGNDEMRRSRESQCPNEERGKKVSKKRSNGLFNIVWKAFNVYKLLIEKLKSQSKHVSCPHPNSCVHYILTGSVKLFSFGLCAQLALKIVFKLGQLIKKPKQLRNVIFKRENLNMAAFLGGFSGLYKLLSCSLRRYFGHDSKYHAIPAGLIASVSFVMYPDNTIALYVMWKAIQLSWNAGVKNEKVPEVKWFVTLLYCFSTAVLFHAAIVEPHNLRPSYWKFLVNLSGGRIATMSRLPLDEFGLETSKALQEVLRKTNTTDKYTYYL